jgi:hypothetical protein
LFTLVRYGELAAARIPATITTPQSAERAIAERRLALVEQYEAQVMAIVYTAPFGLVETLISAPVSCPPPTPAAAPLTSRQSPGG